MKVLSRFLLAGSVFLLVPALASAQRLDGLRLTGELRLRGEAERTSLVDSLDAFTLSRARLGLEASLGGGARVFLQVQDSRSFGSEASTMDASADQLDLHQGWLELDLGGGPLALRAGRQEIGLGNERLVGPVGWSNTGRSFDALRLSYGSAEAAWQWTVLAATVAERGRRATGGAPGPDREDHTLLGAFADGQLLEGWFLFDRAAQYRAWHGVDRATVGGRVELPATGRLTAWAEGSYQFGNQAPNTGAAQQDVAAFMLGGRLALALPGSPVSSLGAGLDYLSGDDSPADDQYQAFNTLYHTGHKWYGYLDLFLDPAARTGDRGLIDAQVGATVRLARNAPLAIDLHRLATAAQRTSAEADDLGWELDLTLPLALGNGQRLQLGYSAFRAGAAAPLAGLGRDGDWWHWGYAMLTFGFSGGVN